MLFVVLAATACTKEGSGNDSQIVELSIIPYVSNKSEEIGTRAPVFGNLGQSPVVGVSELMNVGFSMTKASDHNLPYYDDPKSKNFRGAVTFQNGGYLWTYSLTNVSSNKMLPLMKSTGKAYLCSYYPYDESVTDITSIPFNLTAVDQSGYVVLDDYMSSTPAELDPDVMSGLTEVTVPYAHLTALLTFDISYMTTNNYSPLLRIVVSTHDGGDWLVQKGTYDATTGTLNVASLVKTSSLTFPYEPSYTTSIIRHIMLAPLAVSSSATDRILDVSFVFGNEGESGTEHITGPLEIDLSKMTADSAYGLTAGYQYKMKVSFHNYTILESFDVIPGEPWGTLDYNVII